ncbi:DUF7302 family protein [Acidaminococcus intestini]|uniref:DUF7302 family protein n=1 Tax=Acidaminococcus intestini TaxID=187327 RepID=UPI00265D7F2A|nr:hypothetical protein [Acidaminococcus intestini]
MKIKALIGLTGGSITLRPGEERIVTDETGNDLIQAGYAVKLNDGNPDPKAKKPPKEKTAAKKEA